MTIQIIELLIQMTIELIELFSFYITYCFGLFNIKICLYLSSSIYF